MCARQVFISKDERTIYFEFNKSTLTKQARTRLGGLVAKIKAAGGVEGGELIGYADHIGTPSYNEKLSKKRAETVRAFLAAHGLKMGKTTIRWFGDTEPATDCPANLSQMRKRLIQCLQPDRRVEVELVYDP